MTESGPAPSPRPPKKPKSPAKDLVRILVGLGIFGIIGYVLSLPSVRSEYLDMARLRANLRDTGWQGVMTFIVLGGFLTSVGIPRLWVSAAAGLLYGAVLGTGLAMAASLLGATGSFLLARWFLRGPIKRRMPRRLVPWYERFNQNGFRYMLIMRLFPFSVAALTNLLGGVSKMSFRAFISATAIGYLPLTVVFALFGKGATGQGYVQLALGAIIMAGVILGERYLRRTLAKEIDDGDDDGGDGLVNLEESHGDSKEASHQ